MVVIRRTWKIYIGVKSKPNVFYVADSGDGDQDAREWQVSGAARTDPAGKRKHRAATPAR